MQLFHKYHVSKFYRLMHTEFWLFELSVWLHTFSRSMISIFIPIFLLEMGYSLGQVMLFYMVFNIFDFPLNFAAKWLTYKIGARMVIIWGVIFSAGFFIVLYNLTFGNWALLVLMALFFALYDTFYWTAHLYFFMKCSKNDDNVSEDTSWLHMARQVAGLLAPMFGAGILIFFNQQVLIVISVAISILSIVPLFKIKNIKDRPTKKPMSSKKFLHSWNITKDYILQAFNSFHNVAETVMWPIFIYLIFKSEQSVALIPVIVSITTIIFTFFAGKVRKQNRPKAMAVGAAILAAVWILRVTVENNIFYYISIFLVGLFSILVTIPQYSNIFEKGEKIDALTAATLRNTFSMFPRIFIYGGLYLALSIFKVSFISAAIAMFLISMVNILLIVKKSNPIKP